MTYSNEDAINRFKEFLRFKTISAEGPKGEYQRCASWLQQQLLDIGLEASTVSFSENKPVVIGIWKGTSPELPSILLNSHYDVVPIMAEHWKYEAFEALEDENGFIIGRGTQDMKCVCIQYIEAIRKLKNKTFQPTRTIVLTFVPDEEIGGDDGFSAFLSSQEYQEVGPIAFAFDEGLANPNDCYTVFYGERTPWWLLVKSTGPTGHGSRFIKDTAMEKLLTVCNKALEYRKSQEDALNLDDGCSHADFHRKKLGDVTTLNITMLQSGVAIDGKYMLNVIPNEAQAGFDVRISPHVHPSEFKAMIDEWCDEEGLSWEFYETALDEHYITSIDREKNPWWGIFLDSCKRMNVKVEPEIFPAATDSRYIRRLGVPALGFSPMKRTPILLHDHNEMLHKEVFLEGIDVYVELFKDVFMTPALEGMI